MSILEEARALVRDADIANIGAKLADDGYVNVWDGRYTCWVDEADFTPETLSRTLSYQIAFEREAISDEESVELGASKRRGLPHLPPELEWPDGMYFFAQLNLADLHEVDRTQRLPATGMLYFFLSDADDMNVTWWDGDPSELDVRPYPPADTFRDFDYYGDDFTQGELINFVPNWFFFAGDMGAYKFAAQTAAALPDDLIEAITETLGAPMAEGDTDLRLYGRPQYWQGEDESDDLWDGPLPVLLLLQDEMGHATVHFWIEPDDLVDRDFSECWVTGSGT